MFDEGRNRVTIVGIDALGIRQDTVRKVRDAIKARTGIPAQAILIGASHSHSSGQIVWIVPGEFDEASPLVQRLAYKESTCVDPKYLTRVEQALIDAVCEADGSRAEARAGVGLEVVPIRADPCSWCSTAQGPARGREAGLGLERRDPALSGP